MTAAHYSAQEERPRLTEAQIRALRLLADAAMWRVTGGWRSTRGRISLGVGRALQAMRLATSVATPKGQRLTLTGVGRSEAILREARRRRVR